jgi:hypothetical protein
MQKQTESSADETRLPLRKENGSKNVEKCDRIYSRSFKFGRTIIKIRI